MLLNLNDVSIRTVLQPGDLGFITHLHGVLYSREYEYGISFESYVAEGLAEFWKQYEPSTNRVWICEHNKKIIGFMLLMNRGESAQLRYFLICPEYRNMGLGKKLMQLFMEFLQQAHFRSAYLWTTKELTAAASLYTAHGFRLSEQKPSEVFGKPVVEQKYVLLL